MMEHMQPLFQATPTEGMATTECGQPGETVEFIHADRTGLAAVPVKDLRFGISGKLLQLLIISGNRPNHDAGVQNSDRSSGSEPTGNVCQHSPLDVEDAQLSVEGHHKPYRGQHTRYQEDHRSKHNQVHLQGRELGTVRNSF